jgi:hypothetical protein
MARKQPNVCTVDDHCMAIGDNLPVMRRFGNVTEEA